MYFENRHPAKRGTRKIKLEKKKKKPSVFENEVTRKWRARRVRAAGSPACALGTDITRCSSALLSCLLCEASSLLTGYRRVHAWGFNRFGQLGIDHEPNQSRQAKPDQCEPQFVPTLGHEVLGQTGTNIQRIVSGQNHAIAITEEGDLYVWGNNDMGQLGLGKLGTEDTEHVSSLRCLSSSTLTA